MNCKCSLTVQRNSRCSINKPGYSRRAGWELAYGLVTWSKHQFRSGDKIGKVESIFQPQSYHCDEENKLRTTWREFILCWWWFCLLHKVLFVKLKRTYITSRCNCKTAISRIYSNLQQSLHQWGFSFKIPNFPSKISKLFCNEVTYERKIWRKRKYLTKLIHMLDLVQPNSQISLQKNSKCTEVTNQTMLQRTWLPFKTMLPFQPTSIGETKRYESCFL